MNLSILSLRISKAALMFALAGLAFSLQACSPDTGTEQSAATSDGPGVHEAETAAGQIAETLANGKLSITRTVPLVTNQPDKACQAPFHRSPVPITSWATESRF